MAHGEPSKGNSNLRQCPEYRAWKKMRERCFAPDEKTRCNYVGIGICARWDVFSNFLADVGRKPSPLHSLDRKDPSGNYEPRNVRWATRIEQNRNRRRGRRCAAQKFKGIQPGGLHGWQAAIGINGKNLHLGTFKSDVNAAQAYNFAAAEYFGDFACYNIALSPQSD